ncbi:hypothetical protein V1512DRAFT_8255 [Lipomyces arxii]|uniref:uncharacterized protein n=1 Tax=Lipomyces arxii TaxID=56418 RepID=UPI0034CF716F
MENDEINYENGDAGGFIAGQTKTSASKMTKSSASNALSTVFSPDYDHLDRDFRQPHAQSPQIQNLSSDLRQLSSAQQSKLINYLDDQLLQISRKYVKKFSDSGNAETYLSLDPLLDDISKVVDLLWYSVSATSTTFIQTQYLIKIADDLNDYMSTLKADSHDKLFIFLRKMDKILFRLIVGDIPSHNRMSNTERTRLESVAERTRVLMVSLLSAVGGYEVDVTRVYDAVLEELN